MTVTASVRARFALLTVGRLVLGAAALFRGVEIYKADANSIGALGFLLFGLMLLWWGTVGARALFSKNTTANVTLIARDIAAVDRRAPSGLKPLWIAIAILLGVFLVWVSIAKLIGAS